MGTSLRAVDLVKVLERERELGRERLDASPEFAIWERREFVEEGLDDSWIKDYHRKLEGKPGKRIENITLGLERCGNLQEHHDPGHEAVTSPLKDVEKGSEKRCAQNNAKGPAFDHVDKVEGECGLIEAMLLLKHEGLIQTERQRWERRSEC